MLFLFSSNIMKRVNCVECNRWMGLMHHDTTLYLHQPYHIVTIPCWYSTLLVQYHADTVPYWYRTMLIQCHTDTKPGVKLNTMPVQYCTTLNHGVRLFSGFISYRTRNCILWSASVEWVQCIIILYQTKLLTSQTIPHHTILYQTTPYYTTSHCTMPRHRVHTMECISWMGLMHHNTIPHHTIPHNTAPHHTI